jgi:hypothetical protein
MRIRLTPNVRYLLLIVILSVTCSVGAMAQEIRFVQITDPHLFDKGQEETENKAALAACIKKINDQMNGGAAYSFAVVTGDIGIENLVSDVVGGRRIEEPTLAMRKRRIELGAEQLASILEASRIRVWLFVPGNNDLFDEDPDTLNYYRSFIEELRKDLSGFDVIDLCPDEPDKYELGVHRVGAFVFIGFNNASFKNNNDSNRIGNNKDKQLEYVGQVVQRLKSVDSRGAYIFYHIPELDDPHLVLDGDEDTAAKRKKYDGNPYPFSSWFVDKDVHDEWKKKVVNDQRVRGLFAGHYHDWRRDTYLSNRWMQTSDYSSGSLSKLYVCPPLAIKRQRESESQARGFQEVTIDGTGRIVTRIFWFSAAEQTFDTGSLLLNNQLQLGLAYEGAHEWRDAETYFGEAAKNALSDAVRDSALAGLKRVKDAQHPRFKEALSWTEPLIPLGTLILRVLVVIGILLVVSIIALAVNAGYRAMVIYPFDGDEALARRLAVGFPALRAKVITALGPVVILPQTVRTVYPFVSPRLNEMLPQESFEVAGIKVPNLSMFLNWFVRPRFQVTGGIQESSPNKYVYAEVWRRRRSWFGLRLATLVTREIPKKGVARNVELENFIYEVYLKTNATL